MKPEGPPIYSGSYSYVNPDFGRISVTYTADENGFVPHIKIERRVLAVGGLPGASSALIASLVGG